MIDWITCKISFAHPPIKAGQIVSIHASGEIEWETPKREQVTGSHSSTVSVRSHGSLDADNAEFLMITGNPSKFLQGHNIFGSDDLVGLTDAMLAEVLKKLGLIYDYHTRQQVRSGNFTVAMVDINYSYELENQQDVMAFIHAAEFKARARAGRATTRPGTIYFGQHSRRWALKMYSKFNELTRGGKDHKLSPTLNQHHEQLLDWSKNILRIELRLLSKELKKLNLTKAADLQKNISRLFEEYRRKIIMKDQRRIVDNKLLQLPGTLRSTYQLWIEGHHLAELLTRRTFYRHRTLLLEHGVDISITVDSEKPSNVGPFIRVLEAKPATIPAWAYSDNLIFQPKKRA